MILPKDRAAITQLAEKYRVTRLLLFGSSTHPTRQARDIDLAVEGFAARRFL